MRPLRIEGFTLLETLAVLTMIAILSVFSFPMLLHFLNRAHDQVLQSQLQSAIETASQEARHLGVPVSISGDWQQGFLVFTDENEDGIVHNQEQRLAVMPIALRHGKLYWRAYPYYRHHLLFSPTGLMRNDNASFWFCRANTRLPDWAMTLNKSGRTQIIYPDQQGVIHDAHNKPLHCNSTY